jgi:hypothetical protein
MEIHLAALATTPLFGAVLSLIAATILAWFFESIGQD